MRFYLIVIILGGMFQLGYRVYRGESLTISKPATFRAAKSFLSNCSYLKSSYPEVYNNVLKMSLSENFFRKSNEIVIYTPKYKVSSVCGQYIPGGIILLYSTAIDEACGSFVSFVLAHEMLHAAGMPKHEFTFWWTDKSYERYMATDEIEITMRKCENEVFSEF